MSAPFARSLLRVSHLECTRGDRRVFADMGFELANGGLLQVSGANGSGKSSLMRIVCGLLQPTAGEIEWNGRGMRELGETYGASLVYVGHLNAIKDELNVGENLGYGARLAGTPVSGEVIDATLREFGLDSHRQLPCRFLSQGQKRRLALARLRLWDSRPLWILDEPFTALDPSGVALLKQVIEQHLALGGLALLTTHQEVAMAAPSFQRIELGA